MSKTAQEPQNISFGFVNYKADRGQCFFLSCYTTLICKTDVSLLLNHLATLCYLMIKKQPQVNA